MVRKWTDYQELTFPGIFANLRSEERKFPETFVSGSEGSQWESSLSKASGPDLIPCHLLKGLAEEIAPILAEIFRQSLRDGVIPSIWKNADMAPVFKKEGRDIAKNYRPISLTCVCCKILKYIISSHIRHHLDQYGILSPYQHGFRKLYFETQLLVTIQDLLVHWDKHVPIDMAIFDFSKAFDVVPHVFVGEAQLI